MYIDIHTIVLSKFKNLSNIQTKSLVVKLEPIYENIFIYIGFEDLC